MIVPLAMEHVPHVARLHCRTLTGLLAELGNSAAQAYYTGCFRTGLLTAFVDIQDGKVMGFVCGSMHPDKLRSAMFRRNPFEIMTGTIIGLLRRPTAIKWLLNSFKGPDQGHFDPTEPELTYLAVDPEHRQSGIGAQLLNSFLEALRNAGAATCALSVDDDNTAARSFYEKHGFEAIGSYNEFGRHHRRYRLEAS